jgi:hypothetical protein
MPAIQTMRGPTSSLTAAQRRVDECLAALAANPTPERIRELDDAVARRNEVREFGRAARQVADMMSEAERERFDAMNVQDPYDQGGLS